ncbi:N-acetylmannosamine kinase [Scandinavium goeteborgense]|uniref:N-acetylmannosamine kinase n=1 Tax=Scandinavium goeteborgense TaxID=1851514 RepID=A0A4R6EJH7_SCAGO|nr:N-acetylmannosamine kinase [Scandinavium goeteborgense]TDN58222.1 N-acetylmannosamine kinase [Scandinavium goeteborgense]
MTLLAVDIGGTKLAAALIDGDFQIVERHECPTPASKTPQVLTASLETLLSPLAQRAKCVAVASTGIIHQGILTAINPGNLGGLLHFPLQETVSRITGLPCLALNDAQAAAWAEFQALDESIEDMAFITVSTGVGGGIVSGGELLMGSGGLAGHLGHTLADPNGPRCGCGRIGCVEAIASGRGIAATAQGHLAGLDAKVIFAKAREGDAQAQSLMHRSAQVLARLIADVKAVTDCQRVVMGGSVGLADGYLALVAGYLSQEPSVYQVTLQAAYYRHDAGLLGAAMLAQP